MKLFIDIGHPAHVHYFKNIVKIFLIKGHQILVTARDKEMTHYLLKNNKIEFHSRGKGKNGIFGKLFYLIKGDSILLKYARKFKPDIFLSFSSPYAAQVSWLMNKPHIAFDDTEHAKLGRLFYKPFSKTILSPSCYKPNLGEKHLKFDSYMELFYLHQNYFKPDENIKVELGLKPNERYVILRFVAWQGNHDIGHNGISDKNKIKAVKEFSKFVKVFITSESELPEEIKKNRISIPPHKIHDALAFADLLYGESATMASECAVLGVPSIYLDDVGRGYTDEEEAKYNLVFNYSESLDDQENSIKKGVELLQNIGTKNIWRNYHQKLLNDKIDITGLLVWFIENYPESAKILKKNPDYQYKFK
jgi:uncharacterized protein